MWPKVGSRVVIKKREREIEKPLADNSASPCPSSPSTGFMLGSTSPQHGTHISRRGEIRKKRSAQHGRRTVNPSHKPISPVNLSKLLGIYPEAPVPGENIMCPSRRTRSREASLPGSTTTRAGEDREGSTDQSQLSHCPEARLGWEASPDL